MICQNCGASVKEGSDFCGACGKSMPRVRAGSAPAVYDAGAPSRVVVAPVVTNNVPAEYRPLGAWAYFGYSLLFAIPLIGFILLIVFSFDNSNINRRNYARSFWCWLVVVGVVILVTVLILAATGATLSILDN